MNKDLLRIQLALKWQMGLQLMNAPQAYAKMGYLLMSSSAYLKEQLFYPKTV